MWVCRLIRWVLLKVAVAECQFEAVLGKNPPYGILEGGGGGGGFVCQSLCGGLCWGGLMRSGVGGGDQKNTRGGEFGGGGGRRNIGRAVRLVSTRRLRDIISCHSEQFSYRDEAHSTT